MPKAIVVSDTKAAAMDLEQEVELTLRALLTALRLRSGLAADCQHSDEAKALKLERDLQLFNAKVQLDRLSLRVNAIVVEAGFYTGPWLGAPSAEPPAREAQQ